MNGVYKHIFSKHQLQLITAWRFYLQVTLLFEITNKSGDTIIHDGTTEMKTDLPKIKYK